MLVSTLHLHTNLGVWGFGDLVETSQAIRDDAEELPGHVASRALRKFKKENWIEAKADPDASMGPRMLYTLTEEEGISATLRAAGRELALGERYPIPIIAEYFGSLANQDRRD